MTEHDETEDHDDELGTDLDNMMGAGSEPLAMPVAGSDSVQTIRERLEAKRHGVKAKRPPVFMPVPGHDGELIGEYQAVPWDLLKRIGKRVDASKDKRRELIGHAATIAAACRELWARCDRGTPGAVWLDELDEYATPVRVVYGEDFPYTYPLYAALDGDEAKSAVDGVMRIIAPAGSDREFLVTLHHNELMEWMGEANKQADDDMVVDPTSTR